MPWISNRLEKVLKHLKWTFWFLEIVYLELYFASCKRFCKIVKWKQREKKGKQRQSKKKRASRAAEQPGPASRPAWPAQHDVGWRQHGHGRRRGALRARGRPEELARCPWTARSRQRRRRGVQWAAGRAIWSPESPAATNPRRRKSERTHSTAAAIMAPSRRPGSWSPSRREREWRRRSPWSQIRPGRSGAAARRVGGGGELRPSRERKGEGECADGFTEKSPYFCGIALRSFAL